MNNRYELSRLLNREKINSETLQEKIYNYLEESIISGNLPPDTILSEVELSEIFGTSRSIIREVIVRLIEAGLVVKEPYKNARVRRLTEKDVKELFDVRLALELLAIEKIETFTQEHYLRLKQFIPETNVDILTYVYLDRKFHEELVSMANNDTLNNLFSKIRAQVQVARIFMLKNYPDRRSIVRTEHLSIIESLLSGDKGGALKWMRYHIEGARDEVLKWIKESFY